MEQSNPSPVIENKIEDVNQESIEKIEKALESFSPSPDIVILEEVVTATPTRLAELYDKSTASVKAILGAVLFAVTVQASAGQESQSVEKVEPELSFSQTMEVKEKIKEITGIDIVAEAKKVNREVKLYTPEKPVNTTIVYLGQSHHMVNSDVNFSRKKEIINSQREISTFLTSISSGYDQKLKVFTEGYSEEYKKLFELFNDASELVKNISSFEDLKKNYESIEFVSGGERVMPTINKIFGDKLVSMGFEEVSPLNYVKGNQNFKLTPSGIFPKDKSYTETNDNQSLIVGATDILSVKGLIDIEPSEIFEVNIESQGQKIKEKLKRIEQIFANTFIGEIHENLDGVLKSIINNSLPNDIGQTRTNIFGGDMGSYTSNFIKKLADSHDCKVNKECQELTREIIEKDIPELRKICLDKREDVAIEMIAKKIKDEKFVSLVYGSGHDFTRAVKKWNDSHPEQQFNLVTVKSQKYF